MPTVEFSDGQGPEGLVHGCPERIEPQLRPGPGVKRGLFGTHIPTCELKQQQAVVTPLYLLLIVLC